jgi:hypothetical protein
LFLDLSTLAVVDNTSAVCNLYMLADFYPQHGDGVIFFAFVKQNRIIRDIIAVKQMMIAVPHVNLHDLDFDNSDNSDGIIGIYQIDYSLRYINAGRG